MVDIEIMRGIVDNMFVPVVHDAFKDEGTRALREVLAYLPRLYSVLPPDRVTGTLIVLRSVRPEGIAPMVTGAARLEARLERLPRSVPHVTIIEVLDNGGARVWENGSIDLDGVSQVAVVYRFQPGREEFFVRSRSHPVANPAADHLSVFARPTFSSLLQALEDYRATHVRTSTCFIFRTAWETEDRVFFAAAPEKRMRRSLHQYLYTRLRDVNVHAEQNVDETHPIDLKVTWSFTRSEALIEIKWLGKSRKGTKVVAHWDKRARDGAEQLADYLGKYRTANPNVNTQGYLVVVDGRRRGLRHDSTSVSRTNGMYYENREIKYDPRYEKIRDDFAPPIRMFAEPMYGAENSAA